MGLWCKKEIASGEVGEADRRVLPESIRFANAHNGTKLGRKHIETLLNDGYNRFQNLGFYLVMKATSDRSDLQEQLLRRMIEINFDFSELSSQDARPALDHLETKKEPYVAGGKLAQVSRHGFDQWVNNFEDALMPKIEATAPSGLFMVANAPYVGLDRLASLSLGKGVDLGILCPEKLCDSNNPSVGFIMHPDDGGRVAIEALPFDFERHEAAVVFDDVKNGGKTEVKVREFWGDTSTGFEYVTAVSSGGARF